MQRCDPLSNQRDAFGMNYRSADLRHHDFRGGRFQAIDKDGIVGMTRNEIVHAITHVAGGVRVLADAKPCGIKVAEAEIDAGVAAGAAGLVAVRTVVVQVGEGASVE